jgi:hypothetical protein
MCRVFSHRGAHSSWEERHTEVLEGSDHPGGQLGVPPNINHMQPRCNFRVRKITRIVVFIIIILCYNF